MSTTRRFQRRIGLISAAMGAIPALALANTYNFNVTSGDWNTPGNWSPAGVPATGDTANIVGTGASAQTVTYDFPGTAALAQLNVNYTGTTSGASEVFTLPGGTLTSGGEDLANSGTAAFVQSGGVNNVSGGSLNLGYDGQGVYFLNGNGSVSMKFLNIGGPTDFGSGTFNQSGGTATVGTEMVIYGGAYNLGSGSLSILSTAVLGYGGTGIINQSGGTNSINDL